MSSSPNNWGTFVLNVLLMLTFGLASMELGASFVKSRTLYRGFRVYFHFTMPLVTIGCFINFERRAALLSLFVWLLGLVFTPFYKRHIERRAERAENLSMAKAGIEPVIYLRSFASVSTMRSIEK